MNSLFSSITESEFLGPGTDLVISLLGVLLMSIAINAKIHENEQEYLVKIKEQQGEVIRSIANSFSRSKKSTNLFKIDTIQNNSFRIKIDNSRNSDIVIENDITLQRISFGAQILFESKQSILKPEGKQAIYKVGSAIKSKLNYIEEIIIHGHTDSDGTTVKNLKLGAERGISVFSYLIERVKINPSEHLMSITSFGEYKPVQRKEKDTTWNSQKTGDANDTEELKDKNRRIEIVLNYREQISN